MKNKKSYWTQDLTILFLCIVGLVAIFTLNYVEPSSNNISMNLSYSCDGRLCDIPNTDFTCNQSILTSGYVYCDIDDVVSYDKS